MGVDNEALVRVGKNPRGNNLLGPYRRFTDMRYASPFYSTTIGTAETFDMRVLVYAYRYRNSDGEYIQEPIQAVDLTAYTPSADPDGDDQQVIACLFADYQGVVSVITSTPKLKTDVLTWDDVEECMLAAPIRVIGIRAYKLYTGQTNVAPSDHFGDIREWMPTPQRKNNYTAIVAPTIISKGII